METEPLRHEDYEKQLLKTYKEEAHSLVKGWFNSNKTKVFAQKYIQLQLQTPAFNDQDLSLEKCLPLKNMSALQVQEMLLSDSEASLESVVDKYHFLKKNNENKSRHLTWSFYQKPVTRARELDKIVKSMDPEEVKKQYPLYGYVLSIKDSIYVKDSPSTAGLFVNLDRVPTENPETIQMLLNAGAVITSKGNIPQFLFSMESNNNIYGDCLNPFDPTRTSGGSSGGDAALIATGMVNAGIGSDGAGSLRIPALFCGIDAFKPTPSRLSMHTHCGYFERKYGSDHYPQRYFLKGDMQFVAGRGIGPLARRAKDMVPLLKVMYADQSFDNTIAPMPWNEDVEFKKRIGVIRKLDFIEPSSASSRALQETVQKLEKEGYEVVDMTDIQDLLTEFIYWTIVAFQKNDAMLNCISGRVSFGEPLLPLYKMVKMMHSTPHFLLRIMKWKEGASRRGFFYKTFFESKKINQMTLLLKIGDLYQELEQKMTELDVSAFLTIGLPVAPIRLFDSNVCQIMCAYLFMFNGLNMPAGVCSVTKVKKEEEVYESQHDDYITNKLKEIMKGSEGLPVGVQVVSRAFHDEIVVKIMQDIEK
jgi:fatty acid amide hydrolase